MEQLDYGFRVEGNTRGKGAETAVSGSADVRSPFETQV